MNRSRLTAKSYFAPLLLALLVIAGCAPATTASEESAASITALITVEELNTMLQSRDFPLINVHIPYEGEIPGTDAHIPYN